MDLASIRLNRNAEDLISCNIATHHQCDNSSFAIDDWRSAATSVIGVAGMRVIQLKDVQVTLVADISHICFPTNVKVPLAVGVQAIVSLS